MTSYHKDQVTAYHEAGHAVMAWHVGRPATSATIIACDEAAGWVENLPCFAESCDPQHDQQPGDQERAMLEAMIVVAGTLAQRKHHKKSVRRFHGRSDRKYAANLADLYCRSDDEAKAWLRLVEIRAANDLEILWPVVDRLAKALIDKRSMTGEEIESEIRSALEDGETRVPRDRTCLGEIWEQ